MAIKPLEKENEQGDCFGQEDQNTIYQSLFS